MKERIVVFEPNKEVKAERHFINDKILYKTLSFVDMCERTDTEYKIEQVPETFEDLKELCKKLEPKLVKENNLYETQITVNINNSGYYAFYPDGTIIFKASNSINYTIAKNKTMSQMFQFIKSLIGE